MDFRQFDTHVARYLNIFVILSPCHGNARCADDRDPVLVCRRRIRKVVVMFAITAYSVVATYALSSACRLVLPAAIVAIYHGALAIILYTMYGLVDTCRFEPNIATSDFCTTLPPELHHNTPRFIPHHPRSKPQHRDLTTTASHV